MIRLALFCGAAPLVTGVSIFALWLVTRWPWLMAAGAVTIAAGLVLFLIGLGALAFDASHRRPRFAKTLSLVLLLLNFPVAIGIVQGVIYLETTYRVEVRNESTRPLEHVRLVGPDCDRDLGRILPGAAASARLSFGGDGMLELRLLQAGTERREVIDHYVTHTLSGDATVIVRDDGIEVVDRP